jgi:hypothetical protein
VPQASSDDAARRQASLIERSLLSLAEDLGCRTTVDVASEPIVRPDGSTDAYPISLHPIGEGPAPINVITDGGPTLYLSVGRRGILEFLDEDVSGNLASLISTVRLVMSFGLVEDVQVGKLRVTTKSSVVLPSGRENLGYASTWRAHEDRSQLVQYTPYVSP